MKHLCLFFKSIRQAFTSFAGLLALGLLAAPETYAQAPAWQTAIGTDLTTSSYSEVRATAVDATGNVYVTGTFAGTITIGTTTLVSAGQDEIFVAKWSAATGAFVWAQRAGGAGSDYPNALAVRGTSVYVAGAFNSATAAFGTFTLTNASSTPSADLYVAKLTDAGTSASFTWVQQAGGTGSETVQDLAVQASAVYLTGSYSSPSLTLGTTSLLNLAGSDTYVARLNDNGATSTFAWAVRGGGMGNDEGRALAVSGASLYVAGTFEGTAPFGLQGLSVSSAGGLDAFVAKLTDAGSSANYNWLQRAGGTGNDYVRDLATNGLSVYVAGEFTSPAATFGQATPTNAGPTGTTDGFVARLQDNINTGNFEWAQRLGGTNYDQVTTLVSRGNHVYVAGHFASTNLVVGATTLTNTGAAATYDVFLAHLLDSGSSSTFLWGQQGGGAANDYCRSLALGATTLHVAGSVQPPAAFGAQNLVSVAPVPAGFFATLNDATNLAGAASAALAGVALYPNPTGGAARVTIPVGLGSATLTLLDAVGRVVRTATTPAGATYPLSLVGLASGTYVLRVQLGEAQATQKLLVE